MGIQAKKHKNGFWYAEGTVGGKRIRRSLKTRSQAEAEEKVIQWAAKLQKAEIYGVESVSVFEQAALSYLKNGGDTRFIEPLLKHFRGRALRSITPREIREAADILYPLSGPATKNRQVITPTRAIINHGHDEGLCKSIRVKQFQTPKPQRKAASPSWIIKFRREASAQDKPHLAALAWFMLETGARISEALKLEAKNLDKRKLKAKFETTKNGKTYEKAISRTLCDELMNLPSENTIFMYKSRHSVYGPWKSTCKGAGIEYITPHQAGRHSFATLLRNNGEDAISIAQAGGWKSIRLVQDVYCHETAASRRAAQIIDKELTKAEEDQKNKL